MGYPIDEQEPGDACPFCWGPGKTFGDIPTPKRIYVTGSGFAGACAVCNGTFILLQNPILPCIYEIDDGIRYAEIIFGLVNTQFTMEISGGPNCYVRVEGLCVLVSTFGGITVSIDIAGPPTPDFTFAKTLRMSPSDKTWHEDYPKAGDTEVLRLANKLDRICVYVEYEPEY